MSTSIQPRHEQTPAGDEIFRGKETQKNEDISIMEGRRQPRGDTIVSTLGHRRAATTTKTSFKKTKPNANKPQTLKQS